MMLHPAFIAFLAWLPLTLCNPAPNEQIPLTLPQLTVPITVKVEKIGFNNARLQEAVTQALSSNQVFGVLNESDHRVLRVDFSESSSNCNGKVVSPESFKAEVYDYTNGRAVYLNGDVFSPSSSVSLEETGTQPLPSAEEVAEAARIAGYSTEAIAFAAMPPVIPRTFPNGTSHRVLHIMAREKDEKTVKQFYVNLSNKTVEANPRSSSSAAPTCHATVEAGQSVTPRGTPGRALVTISQGDTTLWTMEITRPSASSGNAGSGVELRNVRYKGRVVLYQAHVPILNVEYKQSVPGCGPTYRDWQNEEYPLTCPGVDVPGVPGFRICTAPPTTIVDPPNNDGGDFKGVAIYADQSTGTVVIKSQLRAGWYRYTSEWRLAVDGTLSPRFGLGGVYWPSSGCICVPHHHHVYWRLDFDIETSQGNKVTEVNRFLSFPPGSPSQITRNDIVYEVQRPRSPLIPMRHWEVSNIQTGRSYGLYPGSGDGKADAYGVGDLWVLKYRGTPEEIDDGVVADTGAHISKFVNSESVLDADVVVWYAAHFLHDESHEGGSHIVGPTIRPIRW
ncbi:copper amine oxidase [Rhypophila decipiens]